MLNFFKQLSLNVKIITILVIITILGFFTFYLYYKIKLRSSLNKIEQIQTQRAQEIQKDIDLLSNQSNSLIYESNRLDKELDDIINSDSSKQPSNTILLEDRFCSKMCNLGSLDSSCVEWAKIKNKICN